MTASTRALVALFIVLFCVIVAAIVYWITTGEFVPCFDLRARWLILIMADFTTYTILIGSWVAYKESSWIIAVPLMVAMIPLGSFLSVGYILLQFYKLSHEEYQNDPLYFVLAKRNKRDAIGGLSIGAMKLFFSVLGCLVLGALIYTIVIEFSPSYVKYFTACFLTTATDMCIHAVTIAVWIAYKESSWSSAFFWIALLACFRGVTVCVYVVRELYYLSPQEPASLIIFKTKNRNLHSSDPPLMAHSNI